MRGLRGSVHWVAASLLVVGLSSDARAQLLIAEGPGRGAIDYVELAYAIGDGPPLSWLSLRLSHAPVALVAALPNGASAEGGLDAWFAALEATASPRVLMPRNVTNCGDGSSFAESAWPRGAGAAPDELELNAPEDVVAALAAQGVSLTDELPRASRYVIWSWPELESAATTRTLRIEGATAPLSLRPSSPFPVLVSTLTRGATQYRDELAGSPLDVTFISGSTPGSNYRERVREWLDQRSEPLAETRSRGLLFDWSIHADLVSIAPLSRSYARRAAGELPGVDVEACATALTGAGRLGPDTSACGAARDAALAFASAEPELLTLQRFAVSGEQGVDPELLAAGGEPLPPVLRAHQLDDSRCSGSHDPPQVLEPPLVARPVDEPRPGSIVVEETVVVAPHQGDEVDCSGSPRPEPVDHYDDDRDDVDCSSDTSSTSEPPSEEAACSGDTSSPSEPERDDMACSGDSTSTSESDESEPDCASDSASSGADDADAGCDGGPGDSSDEQDGYDGDTCTASAAPDGTPRRSRAGLSSRSPQPTRLKTSLWSVALAAVVLPIRRRKRVVRAAS